VPVCEEAIISGMVGAYRLSRISDAA
jgi:hypothetical protein